MCKIYPFNILKHKTELSVCIGKAEDYIYGLFCGALYLIRAMRFLLWQLPTISIGIVENRFTLFVEVCGFD